jgi:adenylosuccinate synthase
MRLVIAVSGPIAVGKSVFIGELVQRFSAVLRTVPSERGPLQEAGEALDRATDGKWVADALSTRAATLDDGAIVIVDSVRIAKQVEHLRKAFGDKVRHAHLTASYEVLSRRFMRRKEKGDPAVREFETYDDARANATEAEVEKLGEIADELIDTDRLDSGSVATLAAEKFGLFPKS